MQATLLQTQNKLIIGGVCLVARCCIGVAVFENKTRVVLLERISQTQFSRVGISKASASKDLPLSPEILLIVCHIGDLHITF